MRMEQGIEWITNLGKGIRSHAVVHMELEDTDLSITAFNFFSIMGRLSVDTFSKTRVTYALKSYFVKPDTNPLKRELNNIL